MARLGRSYAVPAIVNRFRGETSPPTYSAGPSVSAISASAVTFTATAIDDLLGLLTHYAAVATAGSTPTAAQVVAGTGGGIISGKTAFETSVPSGSPSTALGSITGLANNGTKYTAAFTAKDSYGNLATVTYLDFWTTIGQATRGELELSGFLGSLSNPKTISLVGIQLRSGALRPNLTGLHWRWFDVDDSDSAVAPTDHGSTAATDSSGNLAIALSNSVLTTGQYGRLDLETSDKASVGQFRIAIP